MSHLPSTPRRSAGPAVVDTRRAHAAAIHSAGYDASPVVLRAGLTVAAGLVSLGVASTTAHAQGYAPAGADSTSAAPASSDSASTSTVASSAAGDSADDSTVATPVATKGSKYTTTALNVRTGASTRYQRVTTLAKGTKVTTTGVTKSGWTQISYKGKKRWVAGRYLTAKKTTTKKAAAAKPASVSTKNVSGKRATILKAAYQGVGTGYVYGGTSFGAWDCSGFAKWVYNKAGISLPRTARSQAAALKKTNNPQPGDLVLQRGGGHIGVYIGNGKMISALNPRSGTKVHPVSWMPVTGYYTFS